MQTHELLGDYATTDQQFSEQDEIAEYLFGLVAKRDGKQMDKTRSLAWQRAGLTCKKCRLVRLTHQFIRLTLADQLTFF
jgi:hypothetical protein